MAKNDTAVKKTEEPKTAKSGKDAPKSEGTSKNKIKITDCSCAHPFQDETYGKGKRVHNPFKKGDSFGHRCTVCGAER